MPDITVTLSADQVKAVRSQMGAATVPAYVQAQIDAWLQPIVEQMDEAERREVLHAYLKADRLSRNKVRTDLGLP